MEAITTTCQPTRRTFVASALAQDSIEHGTPVHLAEAMQNLNELFRAGRAGAIADDIENLTGLAPRTFRDWCERHIDEFR